MNNNPVQTLRGKWGAEAVPSAKRKQLKVEDRSSGALRDADPQRMPSTVGATSFLRDINASAVLQQLITHTSGLRLREIKDALGLSRPTIEGALLDLQRLGWVTVQEPPAIADGKGRPARTFCFNQLKGIIGAVVLREGSLRVSLSDLTGNRLVNTKLGPATLSSVDAHAIATVVQQALEIAKLPPASLKTLVVAVSGLIGADGEIARSDILPHWANRRVRCEIEKLLGVPVLLENDGNLAGVAEHKSLTASSQAASSTITIMMDERLASSIFVDGALYRGPNGAAGEIGALKYTGWSNAFEGFKQLPPPHDSLAGALKFAMNGDFQAGRLVSEFAEAVARGIAALVLTFDPQVVILTGQDTAALNYLSGYVAKTLEPLILTRPTIRAGTCGGDVVLEGALITARNHLVTTQFSARSINMRRLESS